MAYDWRTELPGIFGVHADDCPRRSGGACICGPLGYRASIVEPESGRRSLSPQVESVAEAQAWQLDQHVSKVAAESVPETDSQLGAVIDDFLLAAEHGSARDRDGQPYSPERLRQLRGALSYVDSSLGTTPIEDVRHRHVQAMLEQLGASGVTNDRLTSIAAALRSLYAYAIQRDVVGFSPVVELDLPDPAELAPAASWNGTPSTPPPTTYDTLTGALAQMPEQQRAHEQSYGPGLPAAMPVERVMWWAVRVVVLLFALIALVLVAESV